MFRVAIFANAISSAATIQVTIMELVTNTPFDPSG